LSIINAHFICRKQKAGAKTASIKLELEGLVRQQRLDSEVRDTTEAKLRDLQGRKRHLEDTEAQYERRFSKVQEFIEQTEQKKRDLEKELATVSAANKAARCVPVAYDQYILGFGET